MSNYFVEKQTGLVMVGVIINNEILLRCATKGGERYIKKIALTKLYDLYEDFHGDIKNEQPISVRV